MVKLYHKSTCHCYDIHESPQVAWVDVGEIGVFTERFRQVHGGGLALQRAASTGFYRGLVFAFLRSVRYF